MDGVLIAQEIIHRSSKSDVQGFLLKLDFEKAYDNVNWNYLLEVLHKRGFGPKWMGWIKEWLKSAKTSILFNGEAGKEIACR